MATMNGLRPPMAPKSRGCFGADWHLFKGDDHSNMIKYKTIAEAETARGDANAEEIAVLRDLMTKLQGGEAGSLVADSELRVKNSELTAKLDEQEEAIKKLKEALTVASTAIESEEAAKLAARVTALAAMDDLKMQNETLKAVAIPMTQEQSAAEARKKVEAMLARQGLLFDGAGNKNTQNSPLGVPQSWKLESLDVKKKGSNAKTLELLYDILKQYPDLYVQCHGETDADASKPADAVLAKFFGFNMMQPIQDCLAENRATAVRDALVSHGIPAERVVVTFKGCGGQSKVDIIPMPAAEALHKMRGKLMRQHTVDLQKISQVDTLEVQPTQAKDNLAAELAAEQAKSKTAASAQKEVDTAVLNAKQAELDAEKAESALELDAEKAKSASLEEALGGLFLATKAELQASAAATAVAVAATASATAVAKADLDAKKAKAVSVEEAALQLDAEKAAADLSSQAHGVLRVQVLSAAGLLAGDANGLSDPFAKIFLGAQPEVVRKTHVQKKTLNPEWGEQFDFHGTLAEMVSAPLEVQLSDSDLGGLTKTALGRVSLPFDKEVINGKLIEGALNTQGTVKLFASFAPLKLVLSDNMHVKKKARGERYNMHHCNLSCAKGFDGWTSYRLGYRDSNDVEHAATVIGMCDNAPLRYEFTLLTHENQGYSIRCGTDAEYTQWTEAIKQIDPPPLSRGHAEETGDAETKKKSLFKRMSSMKSAPSLKKSVE